VDDDDDARETLAVLLRAHGFEVASAWSAEDALRHFREGFRPCIAILDLRMPGVDGWGLYDRMSEDPDLARVPVIIVSGYFVEMARAAQRSACHFLLKPADPAAVVAAVEQHCALAGEQQSAR